MMKGDAVIDSRDIIARIEELRGDEQGRREELAEEIAEARADGCSGAYIRGLVESSIDHVRESDGRRFYALDEEDAQELQELESFAQQAEGYSQDWIFGATLVHDGYFVDYARELAEDLGAVEDSVGWPGRCINWEQAAEELQQDYSCVDFGGEEYWVR